MRVYLRPCQIEDIGKTSLVLSNFPGRLLQAGELQIFSASAVLLASISLLWLRVYFQIKGNRSGRQHRLLAGDKDYLNTCVLQLGYM